MSYSDTFLSSQTSSSQNDSHLWYDSGSSCSGNVTTATGSNAPCSSSKSKLMTSSPGRDEPTFEQLSQCDTLQSQIAGPTPVQGNEMTEFLERKMKLLKHFQVNSDEHSEHSLHTAPELQETPTQGQALSTLDQTSFCGKCIRQLLSPDTADPQPEPSAGEQWRHTSSKALGGSVTTGVSRSQVEKLRFEALQYKLQSQVKAMEQSLARHSVQSCPQCRLKQLGLDQAAFIRKKLLVLSEEKFGHEFRARLDLHLYHKDSLTLLAEIVNSCIRPSATREEVWDTLQQRLELMTATQDSRVSQKQTTFSSVACKPVSG